VLFNVIGGNDLAMHEINAAAETITTAADPDANIIFGATINPELEGEVIITVVATGFDASYYAKRDKVKTPIAAEPKLNNVESTTKHDEKTLSEIDMNLDDGSPEHAHDFSKHDVTMPNIWAIHDDEEADKGKEDDDNAPSEAPDVVASNLESDLEKPSFLRRLGRRKKDQADDKSDDQTDDKNDELAEDDKIDLKK
jgi:hypothetical protein